MKKRNIFTFIAIFFVALTSGLLFSVNVSAATTTYDLWVAGTQVTSDQLSGQGWKFDPDTNTLTLNGFNYGSGGYGYRLKYDAATKTDFYAFIYVKDTNKKAMNLNIKLEGKDSTIGDSSLAGCTAESAGGGYYNSYWGIYNPYGNVTVTGSARLNIYTNQLGVNANRFTVDGCTKGVYLQAFSSCVGVTYLNVKGGSKVNAYCGFGGGRMYNTPIHASKNINIYDTSEIYSEIERYEKTDDYGVSGIFCEGTINVYGGKMSGISIAGGKTPTTSRPACIGIQTKVLNVSGGGVVEALVKQASGQSSYLRSTGICYYYSGNGTINMKGNGIIRAGVQKKNPDGGQTVLPEPINHAEGVQGYCTAIGKEGYEMYWEYTAMGREGIFLHSFALYPHWSYYRDPVVDRNTYSFWVKLNDILPKDSGFGVYSVSGDQSMDPYVEDGEIPPITVESGSLMLCLTSGRTYNFTHPIEVKSGATLNIYGSGIVNGLDVRGAGTVHFSSGTFTGTVQKSLAMTVTGGSVNVDYSGQATDADGNKVSKQAYTLTKNSTFSKVSLITLKNARNYNANGIYPDNGKNIYLWVKSPEEVESVYATPSGSNYPVTLRSQPGEPLLLALGRSIETHTRSVYVASPGMAVTIQPFKNAPTAEQMKDYKLTWSYSDDGDTWTTIEDPDCDSECRLTYTVPNEEWKNRTFRCELRTADTNAQVGVYTATLHVFNPKLVCNTGFAENKMATVCLTEDVFAPDAQDISIASAKWYVSRDGGKSFEERSSARGKEAYSFLITDEMDGWIYRCEARQKDGSTTTGSLTADIKVVVTNKWVKIVRQPETFTATLPLKKSKMLSVGARNVTGYQWQVAKRSYPGEDVPFEDISGANKDQYYFSAHSNTTLYNIYYAYRCVVSNEYSEAVTEEVVPTVYYDPGLYGVKGTFTTGEGDEAFYEVKISPGNPVVTTDVYWEICMDGSEYVRVSDNETLSSLCIEEKTTDTTYDGISYYSGCTLKIDNPTVDMNGWQIRCVLTYGETTGDWKPTFTLKVLTECQQNGHDWLDATCTAPSTCSRCGVVKGEMLPHTGGKATCIDLAVCEVCGQEYGNLDPTTHPDDATDVWNEENWNDDAGHQSKWSCCGRPKYPYEYHKWEEGVCTVCGCICDHSIQSPANCHERAWCHTCHIEFSQIDPDNHDLETLGTTVRDKKEPTCTEDGYTGDIICWECHGVVSYGTVIPANGHSDSWKATCKESAYCSTCNQWFGDIDPNNHAEPWSAYYIKTETEHEQHWGCCDMVTTEPHDFDENGVCKVCQYGCAHTGGEATCMQPALCEKCGDPYGELNPNNHEYENFMQTEETHTGVCMCGAIVTPTEEHTWEGGVCTKCNYYCEHTGGRATCTERAVCDICGEQYGIAAGHTYSTVWSKDAQKHWHECSACGEKTDEEAHTPGDAATETTPQVCTVCNYEITPAWGHTHTFDRQDTDAKYLKSAATCTAKAVYYYSCTCGVSGEETFTFGGPVAHNYETEWSKDGSSHWHACTECGDKTDKEAHVDEDQNHNCDVCNKILGICEDTDHNHFCDVCGRMLSKHSYAADWSADENEHWHECSVCKQKTDVAEHENTDGDHKCDVCGNAISKCEDTNNDHKCDICGNILSKCADTDNDHKCDICGNVLSKCADTNSDHKCDICGNVLSKCTDTNNDHKCGICGKTLSQCADTNNDYKCDVCGRTMGENPNPDNDPKDDDANVQVPAKSVKLTTKTIYIVKGSKRTIKAIVAPTGTTDKIRVAKNTKKKAATATVKKNLITIRAKKVGKTTITIKTTSGKICKCTINVVKKAKKSTAVKLNKKNLKLKKGAGTYLTATLRAKDSTDTIRWSSSNKKVATVDQYGMVTAKKKGTVKITVKTSSGKKATCKITVK